MPIKWIICHPELKEQDHQLHIKSHNLCFCSAPVCTYVPCDLLCPTDVCVPAKPSKPPPIQDRSRDDCCPPCSNPYRGLDGFEISLFTNQFLSQSTARQTTLNKCPLFKKSFFLLHQGKQRKTRRTQVPSIPTTDIFSPGGHCNCWGCGSIILLSESSLMRNSVL